MEERVAADDPILRVVADDDAIDTVAVAIAIALDGACRRARQFRRERLRVDYTRGRLGVGGQPVGHAALARLIHLREGAKKPRDAARIPSALRRVLHADAIRFVLVLAPVLQEGDD